MWLLCVHVVCSPLDKLSHRHAAVSADPQSALRPLACDIAGSGAALTCAWLMRGHWPSCAQGQACAHSIATPFVQILHALHGRFLPDEAPGS